MKNKYFLDHLYVDGFTFQAIVTLIEDKYEKTFNLRGSFSLTEVGPVGKRHMFPCIEELTNEFGDEMGYSGIKYDTSLDYFLESEIYYNSTKEQWDDIFNEMVEEMKADQQVDESLITKFE